MRTGCWLQRQRSPRPRVSLSCSLLRSVRCFEQIRPSAQRSPVWTSKSARSARRRGIVRRDRGSESVPRGHAPVPRPTALVRSVGDLFRATAPLGTPTKRRRVTTAGQRSRRGCARRPLRPDPDRCAAPINGMTASLRDGSAPRQGGLECRSGRPLALSCGHHSRSEGGGHDALQGPPS